MQARKKTVAAGFTLVFVGILLSSLGTHYDRSRTRRVISSSPHGLSSSSSPSSSTVLMMHDLRRCLLNLRGGGEIEVLDDDYDEKEEMAKEKQAIEDRKKQLEKKKERIRAVKTTIMALQQEIRALEDDVLRIQKEEAKSSKKFEAPPKVLDDPNKLPKGRRKKPLPEEEDPDRAAEADEDDDARAKLNPNDINGGAAVGGFPCRWGQSTEELELFVDLPKGTGSKDLTVHSTPYELQIGLKGESLMINGTLYQPVKSGDTFWSIEDGHMLHITLSKLHGQEWWSRVLKEDPHNINTRKCVPTESRMGDLDDSMKMEVEKVMWKQKMKEKGIPTDEDLQKRKAMEAFMAQHPEMDFSKAQIN